MSKKKWYIKYMAGRPVDIRRVLYTMPWNTVTLILIIIISPFLKNHLTIANLAVKADKKYIGEFVCTILYIYLAIQIMK